MSRITVPWTDPTEEIVQTWVEHGGPVELRDIRGAMANLWREGLITLTPLDSGDMLARAIQFDDEEAAA
jgi:hypothetical protein